MTVQKGSWGYKRNKDINGYYTADELIDEMVTTVRYVIAHRCDMLCVYCGVLYFLLS